MNVAFPRNPRAVSLTLSLLLMSVLTIAQTDSRDVVYLKNGSIIKGDILEVVPNGTIKIETSDGNIFVYNMEDVERTSADEASHEAMKTDKAKEELHPKLSRYFLIVRMGPSVQVDNSSTDATDFSVGITNGIEVNKYISLGIGAEATTFVYENEYSKSSVMVYPVFFEVRFQDARQIVQPMVTTQIGYSWVGNKKTGPGSGGLDVDPETGEGGLFYSYTGGIKMQASKRLAVMIEAGFTSQKLHSTRTYKPVSESHALRGNIGVYWNFRADKK